MKHLKWIYLWLFAAALLTTSCDDDDNKESPHIVIVDPDDGGGKTTTDPTKYLTRIEIPQPATSDAIFVAHEVPYGKQNVMNYCLEFSPAAKHSRWVAFRFDAITRRVTTGRSSSQYFANDPALSSSNWIGSEYFRGYDRGHLCASADRVWSEEANQQTFYMSNMSPQINAFNAGIWADFEEKVRSKGRDATFADTLYVVKGGTIASGQTLGTVSRSNGTVVRVPKYYFMACLRVRYGNYNAIGVWLEHRNYSNAERNNLSAYLVSIDELEKLTGIDFFHNLPDDIENNVESTFNPSIWGY